MSTTKLSKAEFQLLESLLDPACNRTNPKENTNACKSCTGKGFLKDGKITAAGKRAMEPYRVKRAVFLAAGFGSRLVPITLNTPKSLIRVKGKRIIDSVLDAVTAAGIEEIYIVRGYLKEQFDQLLYDYPTIRFIDNPLYNETNNISTALKACDKFENAYVIEADNLLMNSSLITKYQYESNYLGVPVKRTDDWCLQTRNGVITGANMGGVHCHLWIGISYWDKEDGKKLAKHIPQVFRTPGGKERLWDMVPLDCFRKDYKIRVRECRAQDVVEIDNLRELQALDESYLM